MMNVCFRTSTPESESICAFFYIYTVGSTAQLTRLSFFGEVVYMLNSSQKDLLEHDRGKSGSTLSFRK